MNTRKSIVALALASTLAGSAIAVALEAPAGDAKVVEMLSGISYAPTRLDIDQVLGNAAVASLTTIANDRSANADVGLQIRALRALGLYSDPANKASAAAVLRRAINSYRQQERGPNLLLLRASMMSLAAVERAVAVPLLLGLLGHPSRDIRAACAQALGITRSSMAIQPLRDRALIEEMPQVQLAIADALFLIGSSQ